MPLKLLDFKSKGQVASLNRWADTVEQNLAQTNKQIKYVHNNPVLPPTLQQTAYQQGKNGPAWTSGSGVPNTTPAIGSMYSRVDGASGSSLYIFNGSAWVAVA